jgi:hypothetical protein
LDHFDFCGLSKGNRTFDRPASSSVFRKPWADAAMRTVTSAWVFGFDPGAALRCANKVAATATHRIVEAIDTTRDDGGMRHLNLGMVFPA